jgi:hypothetical protein
MPLQLQATWTGPQNHTLGLADKRMLSGEDDGTCKITFFRPFGTIVGTAKLSKYHLHS